MMSGLRFGLGSLGLVVQGFRPRGLKYKWVVVKIMVPFWVPIITTAPII